MTPEEAAALADAALPDALDALERLVAIPSVSAAPDGAEQVRRAAEVAADLFREAGLDARVVGEGFPPSVIASTPEAPGAPTVLLYAHLDVQPAGDGWTVPPFEATRRDDVVLGRGAADDTSGVVAHLAAARALRDRPGPRLVVLLEGEEESGSQHLASTVLPALGDIRPDLIVVTDGVNRRRGVPSLAQSLRGALGVDVSLDVLQAPVHSGILGGPVRDAVTALARLIASLHDDEGRVVVEGLADLAPQTVRTEPAEFREQAGVLPEVALADEDRLSDRLWGGVAIAVVGIDATPIAQAANVVLPRATVRLSLRLPPAVPPAEALRLLRAHLAPRAIGLGRLTVEPMAEAEPWAGAGGPLADLAAEALTDAWGTPVERIGGGGGIPVVSMLAERFPDAEIVIPAVSDGESSVHGPDENVSIDDLRRAIAAELLLLTRLPTSHTSTSVLGQHT